MLIDKSLFLQNRTHTGCSGKDPPDLVRCRLQSSWIYIPTILMLISKPDSRSIRTAKTMAFVSYVLACRFYIYTVTRVYRKYFLIIHVNSYLQSNI